MKLVQAIPLAEACGLTTVGQAVMNVEMHALNIFNYRTMEVEIKELQDEASKYDGNILLADLKKTLLTFRKVEQDDLIQLANLYCSEEDIDVAQDYYKNICDIYIAMQEKGDYVFGAFNSENESKLVGAVTVHYMLDLYPKYDKAPYCHLETIIVAKSHQNNGVGTSLLAEVVRQLKNEGVTYIIAQTATDNLAMQTVYNKLEMKPSNNYTLNFVK